MRGSSHLTTAPYSHVIRRPDRWFPAIYLGTALLFFLPALLAGKIPLALENNYKLPDPLWLAHRPHTLSSPVNFLLYDVTHFYYPYMFVVVSRLQHLHLPLWNPQIYSGMPLMGAHQPAVLYPLNILFAPLGPHFIWIATATVRMWLLGWGLHLFVRRLGVRNSAALWAGITYQLCASSIAWLHYGVHNVLAFLPLALYATERIVELPRGRWFLLLTGCLAFQFLGGHPETSLLFVIIWGGWTLSRIPWRRPWLFLGIFALTGMVALLLTAPQLLSTVDLLRESGTLVRRTNRSVIIGTWSHLRDWLLLINPFIYGTPLGNLYWGPPSGNYSEFATYIGVLALPWALVGIIKGCPRRFTLFWIGVAIFSLFARYPLPGYHVLDATTLFRFGQGIRFNLSWSLAAAILASFGVERVLAGDRQGRCLAAIATSLSVAAMCWTMYDLAHAAGGSRLLGPKPGHVVIDRITQFFTTANLQLWILLGSACIGWVVMWGLFQPKLRRFTLPALLLLTLIDLLGHGVPYNGLSDRRAMYPPTPITRALANQREHFRIMTLDNIMDGNVSMTQGLQNVLGLDDLVPFRYEMFANRSSKIGLNKSGYIVHPLAQRFFDLANVEYLLCNKPLTSSLQVAWSLWRQEGPLRVYHNPSALPRAFAVDHVREAGPETAIGAVYDPAFDPRKEAVVEEHIPALEFRGPPHAEAGITPIEIAAYHPEEVELQVRVDHPSLVVLNDSYDTGWKVKVDHRPSHMYRVNGVYRGVMVPTGQHRVHFTYEPASVIWGSIIAAATLLGCLGGVWFFHSRRLRRRKTTSEEAPHIV